MGCTPPASLAHGPSPRMASLVAWRSISSVRLSFCAACSSCWFTLVRCAASSPSRMRRSSTRASMRSEASCLCGA